MRYSALVLVRGALTGHRNWVPAWRSPEPRAAYAVVIVGGGAWTPAPRGTTGSVARWRATRGACSSWISNLDGRTPLQVGAHIAPHAPPAPIEGRVTSSCFSRELGHPVALALLAGGSRRTGERVQVHYLGVTMAAEVIRTPFIDPEGARVHG